MESAIKTGRYFLLIIWRYFLVVAACWLSISITLAADKQLLKQGEAVFRATGGCSCHTDIKNGGQRLAGGRSLMTPFGTVFSTNITPDKITGIGNWQADDFIKAMRMGVGPGEKQFFFFQKHYFPVFPYTSFTRIRASDLRALWQYLKTVPPVNSLNKPVEIPPPFGWRINLIFWNWLNFTSGEFKTNPAKSEIWNRGAYLVRALAHCEECHSPRNMMGGIQHDKLFMGSKEGPEGESAPNITPHKTTGIGMWERSDLTWFLKSGLKLDGDFAEGVMSEVIVEGYQYLPDSDLEAITEYISSPQ